MNIQGSILLGSITYRLIEINLSVDAHGQWMPILVIHYAQGHIDRSILCGIHLSKKMRECKKGYGEREYPESHDSVLMEGQSYPQTEGLTIPL